MRTTFQTPQQQAVALDIVPPQTPPVVCARPAIVRPPPPPVKRAKRHVACAPPATTVAGLRAQDVPLFLPPAGKSRIHMQYYAQNLASVRQVLAQQEISRGIDRQFPSDDDGTVPGPPPGTTPGTTPDVDTGGPHLGDIGYAMFARLIAIAAQLADMDKVTVFSHLEKLLKTAKPNIDIALRFLDYYKMFRTRAAVQLAVAPEPYLELAKLSQEGLNIDDAFAERLHLGAEAMIEAMNCCIEEAPDDWRQTPQTPTVAVAQPAVETPMPHRDEIAAAAPAARIGGKRARKTSGSRSKR